MRKRHENRTELRNETEDINNSFIRNLYFIFNSHDDHADTKNNSWEKAQREREKSTETSAKIREL